jgi:glycosyltransferase involved in cell wall biosynthesis
LKTGAQRVSAQSAATHEGVEISVSAGRLGLQRETGREAPAQPASFPNAGSVHDAGSKQEPPLRFCMVTTFYPPYSFGGDAVFVQRLSSELARRGHHVEVIHCIDAYRLLAGREPVGASQEEPGVIVHGLHSRVGPLSPLATQQTGYPLFKSAEIRRVLDQGFDVIHYHNVSLVGGPAILRYGCGLKLYSTREHWLVCPTHVLFKFNREACTQRSCFACQLSYGRPPQLWRYSGLLKAMIGHVDLFIAPSRFTLEQHRSMGLDARMVYLPNFVPEPTDPLGAPAQDAGSVARRPYFLFLGRLERLKGVQTLIPVFRRFRAADLLIAGRGSFEPRLQKLAEGSPNIRFLGQQSAGQMRALLRDAVALIVPSICYETFGNVTVEAFSLGTPAIVRNIGGLPEPVEQSGGGLIYSTNEELIAAMDQLLGDRAYRDELGRKGYAAYRMRWTPDVHVGAYLALIRDLSARRQQAPGLS